MASPQFGTPVIVQYGNSVSGTQGSPPMIDSRVFSGGFGKPLPPPGFKLPRMPLIQRITPSNVDAQQVIRMRTAHWRAVTRHNVLRVQNGIAAYANAVKMRR